MYLQTSRLQYNLQGVVLLQTAFSKKYIRLSPYGNCTTKPAILQPAYIDQRKSKVPIKEPSNSVPKIAKPIELFIEIW